MYALIQDSFVIQISPTQFPVVPSLKWVACDVNAKVGDHYNGTTIVPVGTSLSELKAKAKANVAQLRKFRERDGVIFQGVKVESDDVSQSKLKIVRDAIKEFHISVDWKGADGWLTLNETNADGLAIFMLNYVQSCFTREKLFVEAIDACTTAESINALNFEQGWPSNVAN